MHIHLFDVGPIKIQSFGVMIAIGIILAFTVAMLRASESDINKDALFDIGMLCVIGGMLGAKLLYIIIEFNNLSITNWWQSIGEGFVLYGGIIGGAICAFLYCKNKKLSLLKYSDFILPSVAIAQGFGRIGCFLAGCCYGTPTTSKIGLIFPSNSMAPSGLILFPTQIFSGAGDFLLAFFLIKYAKRAGVEGMVTGLYLILYGIGRFIIEIFRGDPRGNIGILSTSQFLSLISVTAGLILISMQQHKKHGQTKKVT